MPEYLLTERQLEIIKRDIANDKETINEDWYNTAMELVGLVDPTPITDTINAISYFSQGNELFGVLSLVSALPFYVGDFIAKPVMAALKVGSASTKQLEKALKLSKTGVKADMDAAVAIIQKLSKEPGPVGSFLQKAGGSSGWAQKVNSFLMELPVGPFKGMRDNIMDYFTLLGKSAEKSTKFTSNIKALLNAPTKANMQVAIPKLKEYLKTAKVVDPVAMTKPGVFRQVFFGGLPRIFRSPEGRRIRIMMQQTKWWLGFLDYIGIGNWVGEEEVIKKLGSSSEMQKALEKYMKTPEAKKYFDESVIGQDEVTSVAQDVQKSVSSDNVKDDPIAQLVRNLFLGKLNPIPGL